MISLPSNSQWQVSQKSDLFGSVIATKNMDFNTDGYVALGNKGNAITSSSSINSFGLPIAIVSDPTFHYVIGTGTFTVYEFSVVPYPATSYVSGGSIPNFDNYSDAVMYLGIPHFTGENNGNGVLATYSGGTSGTFSTKNTALGITAPHPICVMENRQTLLVGVGNGVNQYDHTYTLDTTNQLTIPSDYVVTWIRYRQSTAVIGTRNINGGEAKVFFWDGTGVAAQTSYGVGSSWVYSGLEYQSSIVVIASSGRLLRFNGSGFDELATLPVYVSPYSWESTAATTSLIGKVACRGMAVKGDVLYINLDGSLTLNPNENPGAYLTNQPSGLWILDSTVGLYHNSGYQTDQMLELTPTQVASSNIVFATPHQAITGDPVLYALSGALGLRAGQTYYAIVETPNSIQLAISPSDALAGKSIYVAGIPTTDTFIFQTHTQEGASMVTVPGAVFALGNPHLNIFYASQVLFGATAKDSNMVDRNVLMSLGSARSRGYFITPKAQSSQIQDALQKLYTKFNSLNLSTDQIVMKFRNSARFGLPTMLSNGTFITASSFTVDSTVNDVKSIIIGDEVEILAGANAGYLGHITSINTSSSTYVITLSETFPTATGAFQFVVDNWVKKDTLTSTSETAYAGFGAANVGKTSTWSQFKIELRGNNIAMNGVQFINSIQKEST